MFRGTQKPDDRYVGGPGLVVYGLLLLILGIAVLAATFDLWTAVDEVTTTEANNAETVALLFGLVDVSVDKSTGLILLVLLMGALGGFVHAATSFASFAGNRTLRVSWMWWYGLRIPIGAALALAFYFVLRAGLIGVDDSSEEINTYGAASLAFIAGLFSKQAVDKLEEVFNTVLKIGEEGGDSVREDKLEDQPPVIKRIDPEEVKVGQDRDLRIHGQRFRDGAKVRLGDRIKTAELVGEEKLVVRLGAEQVDQPRNLAVAVLNPAPNEAQSNVKRLRVKRDQGG